MPSYLILRIYERERVPSFDDQKKGTPFETPSIKNNAYKLTTATNILLREFLETAILNFMYTSIFHRMMLILILFIIILWLCLGDCVLYWMSRDQRAENNWAMLFAKHLADQVRYCHAVLFRAIPPSSWRSASAFRFA